MRVVPPVRPPEVCWLFPAVEETPGMSWPMDWKLRPLSMRFSTCLEVMVPPEPESCVSTASASAVTLTVSPVLPTFSERLASRVWPGSMVMCWTSVEEKPSLLTRTEYSPGLRASAL